MTTNQAEGTYVDPALGRTTLEAWWSRFIESQPQLAPSTREQYESMARNHILPCLGTRKLATLTRLDIEQWVRELVRDG